MEQAANNQSSVGGNASVGTTVGDGATAGNSQPNRRCNLIVNYLPQSLRENDFNMLFAKIGPLKACKLMFDRQTGMST